MKKQHPLISVIVPIYNVEKYIRKCLDSLKHQTMKEIEVICIDDGSTDNSGKIADEYVSEEFPIFRVIHTENRGLSAARNRGLDEVKSDWIMFVDSDDWVERDFCKIPYEAANIENADLAIFESYCVKKDKIKTSKTIEYPVEIIDEFEAHLYGRVVVWNKLYRTSLFKDIRYPVGHVHEDVAITHKVVHKAQRIIKIRRCLYYNVIRKGSICWSHNKEYKQDYYVAAKERNKDLLTYGNLEERKPEELCPYAVGYLARHVPCSDELYNNAVEIVDKVDRIPNWLSNKQKIALVAWKIDRRLFYFISRMTSRLP